MERGVIKPGVSHLSGLSGGALTAVLTALGFDGAQQREFFVSAVAECVERWGSCKGHINEVLRERLADCLPDDAASKVSGRVRVALSQLDAGRTSLNGSASWVVGEWASKADLVSCLTASDHIPCFTGPTLYTMFRNEPVIDGGYANGFEQLCSGQPECLKVSTFHIGALGDSACDAGLCASMAASKCASPERREPIPSTLYQRCRRGNRCAVPSCRRLLAPAIPQNGPLAGQWRIREVAERCGMNATLPVRGGLAGPYPLPDWGKWNKLPIKPWDGKRVLACEWQEWATNPPPEHTLAIMQLTYDQGVKDAESWAEEHGYLPLQLVT
ncbi:hypothetical protein MNEG_1991 [Monoraphidium neglectum]|uniref:PNPLA domain-containing protein n=1 Tax=Monoraphidium neglectum TaxID=145388 RepID=A0A0D2NN34_9CHLO|nr:hypothetical protein MNEG_1991 [Monoraphidium neglectum]KIZ05966.1 hypothetical protein MNEG_1991 [Monoraphidium neglectum]|eukprot:XP_013904985.1 hypothetical protein MNEG_1991 [Monoraphidium neglectum]